jgi:serine/threonine protein kinase
VTAAAGMAAGSLTADTRLGPYEIVASLGSGGMGDVYTARDTRLDRIVAIEVAQARFSERFEREVRTGAAPSRGPRVHRPYGRMSAEHMDRPSRHHPVAC